jgi:teichuronic acid exporter
MNNIKILNSFLWKLLERASVQGVSFIVSICLARILQPSEYGEIALVMVFINIANVITQFS